MDWCRTSLRYFFDVIQVLVQAVCALDSLRLGQLAIQPGRGVIAVSVGRAEGVPGEHVGVVVEDLLGAVVIVIIKHEVRMTHLQPEVVVHRAVKGAGA